MDLNIAGQYRYIAKEREKLKKIADKIDRKFLLVEKYFKHIKDIEHARKQIKEKKLISQEELFHELGI